MGFQKAPGILGVAFLASILFMVAPAAADEREALARQFAEQVGAAELASTMIASMTPLLREQIHSNVPQLTDEQLDEVVGILTSEFRAAEGELTDLIVTLYATEFTEAELTAAIEFYQTDLGQMMLERMPSLMERSVALGQNWGATVAQRALPRVQEYLAELE
jgi:hypothetical protein